MEILSRRKKCPKCGKGTLHRRVKRHFLVKLLFFWIPIKRYKCDMCYAKSYVWGDVRQNLFMIEVDTERRIILLERMRPGLSIRNLSISEERVLHESLIENQALPLISGNHIDSQIALDYTGEYMFDPGADEFLRKVIQQSTQELVHKAS